MRNIKLGRCTTIGLLCSKYDLGTISNSLFILIFLQLDSRAVLEPLAHYPKALLVRLIRGFSLDVFRRAFI